MKAILVCRIKANQFDHETRRVTASVLAAAMNPSLQLWMRQCQLLV